MNGNEWSIEKQWKYKDYECLITYASNSCFEDYRCGYVVLMDDDYINTQNISCHGGVTCYGWHDRLGKSVVGFDCAHYGDTLEICTLDYCIQQCESIVDQLLTLNKGEENIDDEQIQARANS